MDGTMGGVLDTHVVSATAGSAGLVQRQCCSPCSALLWAWEELSWTPVVLMLGGMGSQHSAPEAAWPCSGLSPAYTEVTSAFSLTKKSWHLLSSSIGWLPNILFSIILSETGGICIAPRPSEEKAEIVPAMAMRPFFGIFPVLMDEKVSRGCAGCPKKKQLLVSALITFLMGEEQDLGGCLFLH